MKHFKPHIPLPQQWDALTTPQMEQLAKLLIRYQTVDDVLVRMVAYLYGFRLARPAYLFKKKERQGSYIVAKGFRRAYILPVDMAFMTMGLGYIFHENEVYPRRMVNPYVSIRTGLLRKKRLYGPADALTNIIVDEWIEVELARAEYNRTNDAKHVARMMAVMWRPGTQRLKGEDRREPLQAYTIEKRTKRIVRWFTTARAQVFLWWYQGCLLFLAYRFPYVFKTDPSHPSTDSGAEGSVTEVSEVDHFGMFMDMVNSMAKDDPTKIAAVRQLPLWEALHNMNKIVKQIKESKDD